MIDKLPYRHVQGPALDASRLAPGYQPVACDFTDELEDISVRHLVVDVAYWDENRRLVRTCGRIADIYTSPEKEEFIKLDHGKTVRLDRIYEVKSHIEKEEKSA